MTVSVVGALEDGLLNTEAWNLIGARMSQALHQAACEPLYGQRLEAEYPELFGSIERAVRDEGVSDRWLRAVSARALGEFVIVYEVHTRVPRTLSEKNDGLGVLIAHGGDEPRYLPPQTGRVPQASQMTATMYSVTRKGIEARVVMQYWDLPIDTAALKFSQRLASEFPEAVCMGWTWKPAPPTEQVRSIDCGSSKPAAVNCPSRARHLSATLAALAVPDRRAARAHRACREYDSGLAAVEERGCSRRRAERRRKTVDPALPVPPMTNLCESAVVCRARRSESSPRRTRTARFVRS